MLLVRNQLLEHPEGRESQVLIQSFACGGPSGPILKAVRYGGQEGIFPDRGLYPNASEFEDNLLKKLDDAIAAMQAEKDAVAKAVEATVISVGI